MCNPDDSEVVQTLVYGKKIWAIVPPTDHNLAILKDVYRKRGAFYSCSSRLEGGIVIELEAGVTVWQPPFCPHAVFTTETSILWGVELYLAECFAQRLLYVPVSMASTDSVVDRQGLVADIVDDLSKVLTWEPGRDRKDGILVRENLRKGTMKAWDANRDLLQYFTTRDKELLKKTTSVWQSFLDSEPGDEHCPVCNIAMSGNKFEDHFWTEHFGRDRSPFASLATGKKRKGRGLEDDVNGGRCARKGRKKS